MTVSETAADDAGAAADDVAADGTDVDERTIEREPPRLGVLIGGGAAAMATGAAALAGGGGFVFVALGGLTLVVAGLADTRWLVDLGTATMFVGVLLSGLASTLPGALLLAMVGIILAWDTLDHAFAVGEQLGTDARTDRVIVVHAALTTVVGIGGAAVSFGVFLLASGGQPVASLLVLLLGVLLVGWALR